MGGMYVLVGENPVPQYMKSHVLFMCKLTHSPLESGPSVTHGPMNPSICILSERLLYVVFMDAVSSKPFEILIIQGEVKI